MKSFEDSVARVHASCYGVNLAVPMGRLFGATHATECFSARLRFLARQKFPKTGCRVVLTFEDAMKSFEDSVARVQRFLLWGEPGRPYWGWLFGVRPVRLKFLVRLKFPKTGWRWYLGFEGATKSFEDSVAKVQASCYGVNLAVPYGGAFGALAFFGTTSRD